MNEKKLNEREEEIVSRSLSPEVGYQTAIKAGENLEIRKEAEGKPVEAEAGKAFLTRR